jgi:hypothetical protein
VASLEGSDTWLRILAAEKAGLINVKIEWPEANLKVIVVKVCLSVGCEASRQLLVTVAPCWDVGSLVV